MEFHKTPPPVKRQTSVDAVVSALKERPGEWALVQIHPRLLSSGNVNRSPGMSTSLRNKGARVAVRSIDEDKIEVWASWPISRSVADVRQMIAETEDM